MGKKSLLQTWYIYPVLLIEGASLMGVELIGAKIIAPYFGNSIYVWASVLSVTLGGLTLGYYFGGKLSVKSPSDKILFIVISLAAVFVFFMPTLSYFVMKVMIGLEIKWGIVLSSLIFLMPPLLFFGMVGPLVVRLSVKTYDNVGQKAGKVYFISTIGGIAGTFLYGFYLVPSLGIKTSVYLTAIALALLSIGFLFLNKSSK